MSAVASDLVSHDTSSWSMARIDSRMPLMNSSVNRAVVFILLPGAAMVLALVLSPNGITMGESGSLELVS
jgi:hypothetical protein